MYNEVFKKCTTCNYTCSAQISQIVLGFGDFNLDDPESLADRLSTEQLLDLKGLVTKSVFYCRQCKSGFSLGEPRDERLVLANRLFGDTP